MASRRKRQELKQRGKLKAKYTDQKKDESKKPESKITEEKSNKFIEFYWNQYKLLLFIPFIILILALASIGMQVVKTGDFVDKDVSLKGGFTITVLSEQDIVPKQLEVELESQFENSDVRVRSLNDFGRQIGLIIDASDVEQDEMINTLTQKIDNFENSHSLEVIGPSLGNSFFQQTAKSVWIAFIFMGLVVFLYFAEGMKMKIIVAILSIVTAMVAWYSSSAFNNIIAALLSLTLMSLYIKYSMPSAAVVLAALSDIIVTIAVLNVLEIKLSTAGIAALLMLIGYSVDTDILLSTRVLKQKEGTIKSRMLGAIKTGLTMNVTTLAAIIIALVLSQSETITQIMTILLIGLLIDIINTWFQNTGILRYYTERIKKNA